MPCPREDARSGQIVFVCHCLFNANAKVCGLARHSGMFEPVARTILESGFGALQLPCPEFLHMGPERWWQSRAQYDVPAYRALCARLAAEAADQAAMYLAAGYGLAGVLGVEGSPSCGALEVYDAPDWGGAPREVDLAGRRVPGKGVFMRELERALDAVCGKTRVYGVVSVPRVAPEKTAEDVAAFLAGSIPG